MKLSFLVSLLELDLVLMPHLTGLDITRLYCNNWNLQETCIYLLSAVDLFSFDVNNESQNF